jgi:ABC-2 type transport system permease protein
MLEILNTLPPAMLEAFSMNAFNLTTLTGFFGVMFAYFGLLASIAAAMWGSDIISKEERDKTVEFSLTLPVTRQKVVTGKIGAALVNCIVLILITWGAVSVNALPYEPDAKFYEFVNLGMLAIFLMQLIFLAVGILLGCAMSQHKRSSAVAVSVLLATYFFSIISGLNKNLEFLKYFSPFKYFNPAKLLLESKFEVEYLWLTAGIVVVSLIGAYVTYSRRDLYI